MVASSNAEMSVEDRCRLLIRLASDGIHIVDLNGIIVEASDSFCRARGYRRAEIIGEHIGKIAPIAVDPAEYARIVEDLFAERKAVVVERKHLHKDGSLFDVELALSGIEINGQRLIHASARDITERKRAEALLREQESLLSMSQSAGHVGSWFVSFNGSTKWSDEECRIFGQSPETCKPSTELLMSIIHPDDRPEMQHWLEQAIAGHQPGPLEFRIHRPDGSLRYIYGYGELLRGEDGTPYALAGISQDITERKLVEIELQNAKKAAEEASLAKTRFLATMSHELRTPLSSVLGFTELLLGDESHAEKRHFLGKIDKSARKLLSLIQDMLDLSKIEAGKVSLSPSGFKLADKIDEVAVQFEPELKRKKLGFSVSIAPQLSMPLWADHNALGHVLTNLIGNAIKFTEQGRIEVVVTPLGTNLRSGALIVQFQVTDTGIGIRPENQGRIFDAFTREDDSLTARVGGTGLGLAIASRLVALMGGEISVESIPGLGSRFTFTANFESFNVASLTKPGMEEPAATVAPRRVLVVEDDEFTSEFLVRALEISGYCVESASNGQLALDKLEQQPFELVLMDVQMPEMDGLTATRAIRRNFIAGCPGDIPIIAMTAFAMPGDRESFVAAGMNDYISKPINQKQLIAKIEQLLAAK